VNWPKEITAFGRKWYLAWTTPDRGACPVAHYERGEPAAVVVIRIVEHNGVFCAGLEGDDKEGLDGALRELEEVAALLEKWPS